MTILITGGAGFIGSTLTEALINAGNEVIIVDKKPLKRLEHSDSLIQIIGDLCDFDVMKKALEFKPEGIVHLAAISRIFEAEQNKTECCKVNDILTKELLIKCKEMSERPWFIYGSSREVYGEQKSLPVKESCCHEPINIYGICKKRSENYTREYCTSSAKGMVLRFSNVYGNEYDILDRVVPHFILNAMKGEPLTINGGSQLFDFTHIDDTVNGIISSINHIRTNDDGYFEDVHLSTGQGTTLQELTKIVAESLELSVEVAYDEPRGYDVNQFVGDPAKALSILGFKTLISIEKGIELTVDKYAKLGMLRR